MDDRVEVCQVYDDKGWRVEYHASDKSLLLATTDYHVKPLRLPLDTLKKVAPDFFIPSPDINTPQASEPEFCVMKKDKCISIDIPKGWSGLIRISRKELYRLGRSLGKRTRRKHRPVTL